MKDGQTGLFCFAMQRRVSARRRKIARDGRCGQTIETQSSYGHTRFIEISCGAPVFKEEDNRSGLEHIGTSTAINGNIIGSAVLSSVAVLRLPPPR
ncbi:hypothetical protein RHEC894_PC00097 (plasmid) [Rhizobium sp. CIAT894]|nr:hypothetical protein RHEC894_PC00097 [Rhizobium sp. CIAT894]